MTETSTVEPTSAPTPTEPAPEYRCPECDKVWPTPNALQGHMIAHKPAVPCPECGKEYKSPGALGNHRKQAHGVPGQSLGNPLGRPPIRKARITASSELVADDIVGAALSIMWPEGVMPVHAMIPLMQWRDATIQFLEKIQE